MKIPARPKVIIRRCATYDVERIRTIDAPLGLYAEDVDPATGRMWGNFPQAYSHVGLIHAAFAASPTWAEVL